MRRVAILLAGLLCSVAAARAQQVTARIAGLERNEEYMTLLRRDAALQQREDSVARVVSDARRVLREDPARQGELSQRILTLEGQLFTLRGERGKLTDRISTIEQEWVLENLGRPGSPTAAGSAGTSAPDSLQRGMLVANDAFRRALPEADYRSLLRAQAAEAEADGLAARYRANYDDMLQLRVQYDTVTTDSAAVVLYDRFQALQGVNRAVEDSLARVWTRIFDNKTYAYAYVLETLGREDLLTREEERWSQVRSAVAAERDNHASDALADYTLRKRALTACESELAGALGLTRAADSLRTVARTLDAADYRLPALRIEERYFLDYEPIGFVTPAKYNSKNLIPECVIYERGTIYRILLGRYRTRQNGGYLFKGAYPMGYVRDEEGRYCYYAGGFATLAEAEEAQRMLKEEKGFVRPEIVVWNDGRATNLSEAGAEGAPAYRVEITGLEGFPEELRAAVTAEAGGVEISRAGGLFIVGPFVDKTLAERVAERVAAHDASLGVKVSEIAR